MFLRKTQEKRGRGWLVQKNHYSLFIDFDKFESIGNVFALQLQKVIRYAVGSFPQDDGDGCCTHIGIIFIKMVICGVYLISSSQTMFFHKKILVGW